MCKIGKSIINAKGCRRVVGSSECKSDIQYRDSTVIKAQRRYLLIWSCLKLDTFHVEQYVGSNVLVGIVVNVQKLMKGMRSRIPVMAATDTLDTSVRTPRKGRGGSCERDNENKSKEAGNGYHGFGFQKQIVVVYGVSKSFQVIIVCAVFSDATSRGIRCRCRSLARTATSQRGFSCQLR